MKAVGVIPARYASTRFEGKPLADLCGKPVIQRVYESAARSRLLERVVVATDDARIFDCVKGFGGEAVMTSRRHRSGTDRMIEASKGIRADVFVNIQGDEPFIQARLIDAVVRPLAQERNLCVSTAAVRITERDEIENPNNVKVVIDARGDALYFSRSPIPYVRDGKDRGRARYYKHIGIYGYRKSFLRGFSALPYSRLEETEKLEQLRVVEAGYKIRVIVTKCCTAGIDTKEDLARAQELFLRTPRLRAGRP
jgi:3-deoxy-manno-octulosonate cytidylyltransferase (CMP-KDO synthetase)